MIFISYTIILREKIIKNDKIIPNYNFCYEEDNIYKKSNNNININELETELKDINGWEDEHSIEYNKIKDYNINNDNQEMMIICLLKMNIQFVMM